MAISISSFVAGLRHRLLLWLGLGLLAAGPAYSQVDSLGGLTRKLSRYQWAALPEKLFLHLDRPLYSSGETMWFRIYAVDGTYGRPLSLSTVAYVEVLDQENRPVRQGKIALTQASGQGSFLLPTTLASGSYTVRAYTSWMKNFGPEYYFHCPVTVLNTSTPSGTAARKDSAAYDVQFFPEGGTLVRGISSKVAFKVTDHRGRGVAAAGKVVNQQGREVARFTTLRFGMGAFSFTPEAGATYTAQLTLGSQRVVRPLPRVFEQGYVLRLTDTSPGQLTVAVAATTTQPETVFLLAHSRQKVAVAAQTTLASGRAVFVINKAQLLPGVSHFTLFNAGQQPVCERLYFQPPPSQPFLTARADKAQYTTRDKVTVQVAAPNQPPALTSSLSMAVYRLDSLNPAPPLAIDHYLWLAADLKGHIENPGYYFTATEPTVAEAADNLMLTQGWSRFRWEDLLTSSPPAFDFLAEPNGPLLRGQLTRAGTTTPCPGIMAYLSSPSRIIRLTNSLSSSTGLVQFEMGKLYGPQEIIVQTDPRLDSTCQLAILDPFSPHYSSLPLPFGLTARFQSDYAKRHLQTQMQNTYFDKYRNRFVPTVSDSLAFYGKANETYLLDKYTRFKVLEEVLREYVPGVMVRSRKDGYHLLVVDNADKTLLQENPLVLLDGVPMFNTNKLMAINPLKIQKLEVVTGRYVQGTAVYPGLISFTTYKGNLDGFELDPRVLARQYEGLQQQREFYAPRYDTPQEKQSRRPDLRNLLYWNPAITLTGAGAQPLEFYTGDQAGHYRVVVQGLSATGQAGSAGFTVEVKPAL
jgi:hypothetical protein